MKFMKKKISIRIWQIVVLSLLFLLSIPFILALGDLFREPPYQIASRNTGLNIPSRSEVLYSRDWNRIFPAESGYDFIFKIPANETGDFEKQLSERYFDSFSDTTVIIKFCSICSNDTIRNGFIKRRSIKERYIYDSDTRLFYYHLVDY
jgi:hypothetical protein